MVASTVHRNERDRKVPDEHPRRMWHDPRTIRSMALVRPLLLVVLCALPCTASAQPWRDAYQAEDYRTAADLLHPLVSQLQMQPESADPDPARHLATMYAQGLGVSPDVITACSLAQVSGMAMQMAAPKFAQNIAAYDASLKDADAFISKHCDGLTERDRTVASQTVGCFAFGMPEEVFTLGTQTVQVGRGGIRLADALEDKPVPILNCPLLIARVRALTIVPPADAAPGVVARHFVEVLYWEGGQKEGESTLSYVLEWQLYEVLEKKIQIPTMQEVDVADKWPTPALPQNLDARLTIEMIRSGHVRWRIDGKPPKRGWVMLPEEKTR